MIRALLEFFGFRIVYVCNGGEYPHRYSTYQWGDVMLLDLPRLRNYAPPWAKMKIRRISPTNQKGKS